MVEKSQKKTFLNGLLQRMKFSVFQGLSEKIIHIIPFNLCIMYLYHIHLQKIWGGGTKMYVNYKEKREMFEKCQFVTKKICFKVGQH